MILEFRLQGIMGESNKSLIFKWKDSLAPARISKIIRDGGTGVLPTDTIYGLVASALDKKAVGKVYKMRERNPKKPFIILISSVRDLEIFGIRVDKKLRSLLFKFWPGKVSVILPCPLKRYHYLHRGTNSLAFRLPANEDLIEILKKTGPLIAPSANLEGLPPAKTIERARKYFGDQAEFYADSGKLDSPPSTLIRISANGEVAVLRRGAMKI